MMDLHLQSVAYPRMGSDEGIVEQLLGWSGTVASLYLFASPLPTIQKVISVKGTSEFSDTTFVITCFNCSLWIGYALLEGHRIQPFATNCAGLVLSSFYLFVFFAYHTKRNRLLLVGKLALLLFCTCLVAVLSLVGGHGGDRQWAAQFLGLVADVANGIMYAAPLSVMCLVIRTASVEFMPLGLTLGTFASSVCWTAYSLWVGDVYIGLPNLAGLVLGLMQIALYVRYGCCSKQVRNVPLVETAASSDDMKAQLACSESQEA